MKTTRQHQLKLEDLSRQMRENYRQNKKVRIYHGTTNSTRIQEFKKDQTVDISHFDQIIFLNKKEKYAVVESNVSMDKLVTETLKYGLIPPVVMEFPSITVGGGIQGGAGESSGFRYGLFNNCFTNYEVILGNGAVFETTPKKNPDLFYGVAGTYGSLGIISAAQIKLIEAKKFVKLSYQRTNSFEETVELVKKQTNQKFDYIDAIIFSKHQGLVMAGELVNTADLPVRTFSKSTDPWFYLQAETITKNRQAWQELIPLTDYLFRYDRGAFWSGKSVFQRFNLPFNRLTRFLFNPIFKTKTMFRFMQAMKTSQLSLIQDVCLPQDTAVDFLNYLDKKLKIYPLWICPDKPSQKENFAPTFLTTDLVINIGVWGRVRGNYSQILKINRDFENKVTSLSGRKALYGHSYYSEEEFWRIYNKKDYQTLRSKYHAKNTLFDVYEKVIVTKEYKSSAFKGLWSVLTSPKKLPVSG